MDFANSVNGVQIRLTHERWWHIVENHDDLASHYYDVLDAVEFPDFVIQGNAGSLKAIRSLARRKWLVVVYREVTSDDGFIITTYITQSKPNGVIIWRQS